MGEPPGSVGERLKTMGERPFYMGEVLAPVGELTFFVGERLISSSGKLTTNSGTCFSPCQQLFIPISN
ncbi:hypothetical protein [Draconibacterium sediminis]|uniref:hypothetical protein n=1 Tax=Draconibacterium sediminis TaxID=1544798 RepID=UPI0026EE408F|nr:hypothetical protein [Draconibacterium sediminis]